MEICRLGASAAVLGLIVSGGVVAVASAAPPGCSQQTTFTISSTGVLKNVATGSCGGSATRTLVSEIKWDKTASPDPLVAKNSQIKTGTSYSVTVTSCDGGNTRAHYGRSYFAGYTDYTDSSTNTKTSC